MAVMADAGSVRKAFFFSSSNRLSVQATPVCSIRLLGHRRGIPTLSSRKAFDQRWNEQKKPFLLQAIDSASSNAFPAQTQEFVLLDRCRAILFYLTATVVAVPLFVVMLVIHPFVLLFDKHRRKYHHLVNKLWAGLSTYFFYKVDIVGKENLPGPNQAAVYVANHQSFLDIFALFELGRPFKFISKTSIFFIPIVGWAMFLTGHLPLRRMDTKSQVDCLKLCIQVLKQGASVFFFPEGTRSRDGKLSSFKKGAFTVASKAKVPVVPISVLGTGDLMPNGKEFILKRGSAVKLVIHPPLNTGNVDELCNEARRCIAAGLEH